MKWSIMSLTVLGVIAAVAVTVLVGALQTSAREQDPVVAAEVTAMVAARNLQAARIIEASDVAVRKIDINAVPEVYFTDPVQIVGKVLRRPMVEGQVLNEDCLARDGSGLHVVSALPAGMRAVAVSLSESSGLHGLLYPGCMVDVLSTSARNTRKDHKTRTLLEEITVLAIADKTIVSPKEEAQKAGVGWGNKRHMVTLMLRPRQAEVLHQATQHGAISLSLRHPLDTSHATAGAASRDDEPQPQPARLLSNPLQSHEDTAVRSAPQDSAAEPTTTANTPRENTATRPDEPSNAPPSTTTAQATRSVELQEFTTWVINNLPPVSVTYVERDGRWLRQNPDGTIPPRSVLELWGTPPQPDTMTMESR